MSAYRIYYTFFVFVFAFFYLLLTYPSLRLSRNDFSRYYFKPFAIWKHLNFKTPKQMRLRYRFLLHSSKHSVFHLCKNEYFIYVFACRDNVRDLNNFSVVVSVIDTDVVSDTLKRVSCLLEVVYVYF